MLETIPPLPVNDLVFAAPNNVELLVALFWNPEIIAALSTLGLKSITSLKFTLPNAGELYSGILHLSTPASCKYESTVQKSPAVCSK